MSNLEKDFSQLYDQYINKIYRFIIIKVNSEETAQDICSEAFLRTWQAFQKAGNPGHSEKIANPSAFLYKIANNLVVDYYREKGRTQFISLQDLPIADPKSSIEDKITIDSDFNHVRLALANLNDNYQNIIIWHYLDDLSVPEIAKILDKQEGAVRVQLHRALKQLKGECNKIGINTS